MSTDNPADDARLSPASVDEPTFQNGRADGAADEDAPPVPNSKSSPSAVQPKVEIEDLDFWYDNGDTHALQGISMDIAPHQVTALIGPSGCGKSTLLRCVNRMNELIENTVLEGGIHVDGQDIYAEDTDPVMVRRRVGMVFQEPNPFPKTIYKNVAWGAEVNGYTGDMDALVERSLRQAALWDEVKDQLHSSAYNLSGGQQQRLCIARTLAVHPDVVLMDEPASALDPIATSKVEETITELKQDYTIVIVTHNMQQASRISDETAFLYMGRLVEMNPTDELFTRPEKDRTEAYVTGRFG
ncbi:MAG: phosphate ABC transporter ATP-binding protein [Bacteroidetes bacterium SW_9_63_38]|nr:MAG: phosphate ABC transporter ATP-binding protein [Bacteroidetes bacterium SW_9_63_38]